MTIIKSISSGEFEIIVNNAQCYADICRKLGLRSEGEYYKTIKSRIKKEGLDTSHFLSLKQLLSKNRSVVWINKENFLDGLKNKKKFTQDTIKKKLIEFDLIPYKCEECHIDPIWNNKKLILQ